MKQENGKGMIKALLLFVIMIVIIVGLCMSITKSIKEEKNSNVISNMMLIQGKCKVFNDNRTRTKSEDQLIGTKLSDIGDDEKYNLIKEFKQKQVISEEEYEKYYVLTDENLKEFDIDIKNEDKSYYLINYETNEVIITKGYEGKYKLSEIEQLSENKENDSNNDNAKQENGEE